MKESKLLVVCMLIITGCGGSEEADKSSARAADTPTFGSPSKTEDGASQQAPQNTTCADACGNAVDWCGDSLGSEADCQSVCPEMGQSMLNCLGAGDSCEDITGCFEGVDPGDEDLDADDDDLVESDNQNTGGENGSSCSSDNQCDSGLCYTPASGNRGTCRLNDIGETCRFDSDCEFGVCLVRSNSNDIAGFCSRPCESFSDCPSFWDCSELNNAAGTYCIQT